MVEEISYDRLGGYVEDVAHHKPRVVNPGFLLFSYYFD